MFSPWNATQSFGKFWVGGVDSIFHPERKLLTIHMCPHPASDSSNTIIQLDTEVIFGDYYINVQHKLYIHSICLP